MTKRKKFLCVVGFLAITLLLYVVNKPDVKRSFPQYQQEYTVMAAYLKEFAAAYDVSSVTIRAVSSYDRRQAEAAGKGNEIADYEMSYWAGTERREVGIMPADMDGAVYEALDTLFDAGVTVVHCSAHELQQICFEQDRTHGLCYTRRARPHLDYAKTIEELCENWYYYVLDYTLD